MATVTTHEKNNELDDQVVFAGCVRHMAVSWGAELNVMPCKKNRNCQGSYH